LKAVGWPADFVITCFPNALCIFVKFARSFSVEYGIWKRLAAPLRLTSPLMTLETARSMPSSVHFRPGPFLMFVRTIWNVSENNMALLPANIYQWNHEKYSISNRAEKPTLIGRNSPKCRASKLRAVWIKWRKTRATY
jgi:hypothetical protein